jgi:cellulose 1,4-beta-cellobiosidase
LDGADYEKTYGVTAQGADLKLGYVTGSNVGSRLYLMQDDSTYTMFKLKNQEFTFDVDATTLPCGLNGALYFVAMDADGGMSRFDNNNAGAKFGTGYCDAQCPHDIKFINGEANLNNWNDTTAMGAYGSCCTEMDIWEANTISNAYTPHPCNTDGQKRCEDPVTCGDADHRYDGVCDKDGCDLNPFRMGVTDNYGPGSNFAIDSTKKMTVVTQFVTSDNTASGDLVDIRRLIVQNGQVIQSASFNLGGHSFDSVNDNFCAAQKTATGDRNAFSDQGGLKRMGDAMENGMVLVMSLWDDAAVHMLWLDSTFPTDDTSFGGPRGTCPTDGGDPAVVRKQYPNAYVTYSNIKFGDIGSTYQH